MTLESTLEVNDINPQVELKLNDIDTDSKKYSAEQFYKDLEKAQQQEISINRQDPRYIPSDEPAQDGDKLSPTENEIPIQDNPLDEQPEAIREVDEDDDVGHGPIPKKRFNKEIEKRKALEEQLSKEREERIRAQATIDMYNKALEEASKVKQELHAPRPIDPIDNDAHEYYVKEINELKQQLNKQNENLTHTQQQTQINNALLQQRAAFIAKNPDFDQAYQHVFNAEVQRNELIGYEKSEAMRLADESLMQQAVKALQVGKDVPSMLYSTAKAFGYAPKAAAKTTGPNLRNIERNIPKSDSILNDIPEVSSRPAPEAATYVSNDGFARHLMNKDGRGVDPDAFKKAIEKLRSGM